MSFLTTKSMRLAGLVPPVVQFLTGRRHRPQEGARPIFVPGSTKPSNHELLERIQIPIEMTTPDQQASEQAREQGLYLARQDRWEELAEKIKRHDRDRATTCNGQSLAELMAYGARSDVVGAAEHALLHGKAAQDADYFAGIEALEAVLLERADCYATALIVAHMHIDIGWAWRGARNREFLSDLNREAFEAHFARAAEILADHCPSKEQSAALLSARCALLPGREDPGPQLVREFESLLSQDPQNPRHMRALGNYLLPRWYGNFQKLDLEARRAAACSQDIWGAGAYAWVWLDALLVDPDGFDQLEIGYFLEGIQDILTRRPDQYTANLLAAHLFKSWQTAQQRHHETGHRPDLPPVLRQGFETIVRDHLRALHPLVWGHAEIGFENTARLVSPERLAQKGRQTGLTAVAQPFLKALKQGYAVQFSPEGISQIRP